jgi:cell division protein FtsW
MSAKRSPDFVLFSLTITLLVIGVFMVFDASYARAAAEHGDKVYFLKRQGVFAIIGLLALFAGMKIPYWQLRPIATGLLMVSIIGLGMVFIPGLGSSVNGATRWVKCPGFGQFQPSELAKLGLILYLANYLVGVGKDIRDLKKGFFWALVPLAPIGILIMAEPDMGTTIALTGTALTMIFMAGARKRHVAAVLAVGLLLGSLLIVTSHYRRDRMLSFANPFRDYYGTGYQICRSLTALGSGGPLGVGLCEGREKLFYLPEEHTDFIFAVLGEEGGLIGTLLVAGLFLGFGARGFIIAFRTKDSFGRLLAGGISAMISGQALLNMLVVTSSIPATGVPLPFISYGGSSLTLNLFCVGILLGVSKYPVPVKGRK